MIQPPPPPAKRVRGRGSHAKGEDQTHGPPVWSLGHQIMSKKKFYTSRSDENSDKGIAFMGEMDFQD